VGASHPCSRTSRSDGYRAFPLARPLTPAFVKKKLKKFFSLLDNNLPDSYTKMSVLFILAHYGKQPLPLPPTALFHVHDEPAGTGAEAARLARKQRTGKA
jgi:hypothetical protein